MNRKWIERHTSSLDGKTVAVTGATGGIGNELCRHLLALHADLILLDRNPSKSATLRAALLREYPNRTIQCITVDLERMDTVRAALDELKAYPVDVFLHNAGAYSIPRHICDTGFDNVFQINFVSPYYMIRELLPLLRKRKGRVVVVGSVAHTYSVIDPADIDFSTRKQASKVYGNAKRFLMFSLYELFKSETDVSLAVTHPGITFTNITAHYPPLIFAVIKHPMKIIFMKPKTASLSIVRGLFESCGYHEWIGPCLFDVWGMPKKRHLRSVREQESNQIDQIAQDVYQHLNRMS